MFCITYSEKFKKHYKKLSKTEQDFFKAKIKLFLENTLHPSLRVKKIQGTENLFEFSVNMDIRVIWYYENDKLVVLVDIGHHDILRNY